MDRLQHTEQRCYCQTECVKIWIIQKYSTIQCKDHLQKYDHWCPLLSKQNSPKFNGGVWVMTVYGAVQCEMIHHQSFTEIALPQHKHSTTLVHLAVWIIIALPFFGLKKESGSKIKPLSQVIILSHKIFSVEIYYRARRQLPRFHMSTLNNRSENNWSSIACNLWYLCLDTKSSWQSLYFKNQSQTMKHASENTSRAYVTKKSPQITKKKMWRKNQNLHLYPNGEI